MAYKVDLNVEEKTPKKSILPQLPKLNITRSIILILSFAFYYFFVGLAIVFGRKIPKSYRLPSKDVIDTAFTEVIKKEAKNTSKVIDLDYTPPPIDLMKQ